MWWAPCADHHAISITKTQKVKVAITTVRRKVYRSIVQVYPRRDGESETELRPLSLRRVLSGVTIDNTENGARVHLLFPLRLYGMFLKRS